jgi:hypothetical protein
MLYRALLCASPASISTDILSYVLKYATKYGTSVLTFRENVDTVVSVFLPHRYSYVFSEEDLTTMSGPCSTISSIRGGVTNPIPTFYSWKNKVSTFSLPDQTWNSVDDLLMARRHISRPMRASFRRRFGWFIVTSGSFRLHVRNIWTTDFKFKKNLLSTIKFKNSRRCLR